MKDDRFDMFFSIVWYNGYSECIEGWIARMESGSNECPLDVMPNDRDGAFEFGQLQALWMILVNWFGDYGGSPRHGWIEESNLAECTMFLKKVVEKCNE